MSIDGQLPAMPATAKSPAATDAHLRVAKRITSIGQTFWFTFLVQIRVDSHSVLLPVLACILGRDLLALAADGPTSEIRRRLRVTAGIAGLVMVLALAAWLPGWHFVDLDPLAWVVGFAGVSAYGLALRDWCTALDLPGFARTYRRAASTFTLGTIAMVVWLAIIVITGDPGGRVVDGMQPARFLDRPVTAALGLIGGLGSMVVLFAGGSALAAGANGMRRRLLPNLRTSNVVSRRARRRTAQAGQGARPSWARGRS